MELCVICQTDEATERHHVCPRSKGGKEWIMCCHDCGDKVHSAFNNIELSIMTLGELLSTKEMQEWLLWKKKHPGDHSTKMSNKVKEWKKYHR